ncbi:MAG: glycine cleavage system aminomethyltransferase GcvT [Alphaproteobacteria bacterium PRO2]|nr:glycine cleavage system aminomethyltransferase GcvT [Alphaproteobacteria bacterium PRO2]
MRKTPLHRNHTALGAKMGEFAGYDMPLYYKEGVIKEHEWVRSRAGLFDVSHMGQVILTGPEEEIIEFWERMTPSGFAKLGDGAAKYTVLTGPKGGMIDDLIVTRIWRDKFFAVLNAGRKDVDIEWLRKHLPESVTLDYSETEALLALQGQDAEKVMRETFGLDLGDMNYMSGKYFDLDKIPALVSRLGYTGEDGFEISISAQVAPHIWDVLMKHPDVMPIGLAARDSLRLEMGYPLYGHDIDETTSPAEANLSWILRDKSGPKPERLRVGVKLLDKGVAREGAEIRNEVGEKIGSLTSGGFSPSLKESIGMGYIETPMSAPGTKIFVHVRGRDIPAEVVAMPFLPARTKMKKQRAA